VRRSSTHTGTNIGYDGEIFRVDMAALTGGSAVTVYGQQEGDAVADVAHRGGRAGDVLQHEVLGLEHDPHAALLHLACDYVAACDGFHGVGRGAIPADVLKVFERVYPTWT
jgi:p-hydroxybenzoate 3-monooxygenase